MKHDKYPIDPTEPEHRPVDPKLGPRPYTGIADDHGTFTGEEPLIPPHQPLRREGDVDPTPDAPQVVNDPNPTSKEQTFANTDPNPNKHAPTSPPHQETNMTWSANAPTVKAKDCNAVLRASFNAGVPRPDAAQTTQFENALKAINARVTEMQIAAEEFVNAYASGYTGAPAPGYTFTLARS